MYIRQVCILSVIPWKGGEKKPTIVLIDELWLVKFLATSFTFQYKSVVLFLGKWWPYVRMGYSERATKPISTLASNWHEQMVRLFQLPCSPFSVSLVTSLGRVCLQHIHATSGMGWVDEWKKKRGIFCLILFFIYIFNIPLMFFLNRH